MRVLTLSWEYPPVLVGGLGRHVDALSRALADQGHDCRVVSRGAPRTPATELRGGVHVVRSAADPLQLDFTTESLLAWSMAHEHALLRAALPLLDSWRPDVIHAHDWLVAQSAHTIAQRTGAPLVVTLHATEGGRHQGWLPAPLHRAIHSVERWLAEAAAAVITCSGGMADEAHTLLGVPRERIVVVPNGIEPDRWRPRPTAAAALRADLGVDGTPLLGFAGRLVYEKGLQDLLNALPALRRRHGVVVAVAGSGPYADELAAIARRRRVGGSVRWLGFLNDAALAAFFGAVDVAVVPSHYEPFGIVALESAAAGTPTVVARSGGLGDLVDASVASAAFAPGDVAALVAAVSGVLADPAGTRRAARRARDTVRRDYSWAAVAATTAAVYERVTR